MKRIPQLDGLRALAFLAVFLNHSIYIPMAWVGVDLFFVLSGFLITNILLAAKEQNTGEYFKRFYARRACRILPPYFIVLALVAVSISRDIDWPAIWWHFFLFLQNFSVGFHMKTGVLNPYWSLAVEEQYYLVWPLLVYFLSRKQLKYACGSLIFIAPLLRLLVTPQAEYFSVIFCLTPFRADLLASGSLLAIIWTEDRQRVQRALPLAWCTMLFSAVAFVAPAAFLPNWRATSNWLPFNVIGYSLGVLLFASMLTVVLTSESKWLQGFLRHRALMWIGAVSYMCYLVHEPVLYFTMPALGRIGGAVAGLVVTLVISGLSWKFIEQPILHRGKETRARVAVAAQ